MKTRITITLDEYVHLMMRTIELDLLECEGVDNWSGYEEILHEPDCAFGDISFKEYKEQVKKMTDEELVDEFTDCLGSNDYSNISWGEKE